MSTCTRVFCAGSTGAGSSGRSRNNVDTRLIGLTPRTVVRGGNDNVVPFGPGKLFIAENYPEAVGIMTALQAGVALSSVRQPLAETKIFRECSKSYTEKDSRVDDTVRIAKK